MENKIYEAIKYFKKVSPKTYQLLGWLGYTQEEEFRTGKGIWTIFTKREFTFPYFVSDYSSPVNRFVAIYSDNGNSTIVYGSFETMDKLKENLELIVKTFFPERKKFLFIPLTLTEENAQDYGYIRGLIFGISLLSIDIVYSWHFKLREGILTGFIEYIKRVYDGNPALGIQIGILGTGLYFGFLLIFIPILMGNIYVKKEEKQRKKMYKNLPDEIKEFEFGVHAEQMLKEEFEMIVEEKRKEKIYQELITLTDIEKNDFDNLYFRINQGFLSSEGLLEFIKNYKEKVKDLPIEKFLEIVSKYKKAPIESEIKIHE